MTFLNALQQVAAGQRVTREGWHNVTMFLKVWTAITAMDAGGGVTEMQQVIGFPYTVDGQGSPVTMSPEDMLATDWVVLP